MLKNNKISLIISSIIILLPLVLNFFIKDFLNGALFLPLLLFALHWVCILFTFRDNRDASQSPKVIRLVLWIIPVVSLTASVTAHLFTVDTIKSPHTILYGVIGALFIIIGNFLPKTRQNRTVGIKVKWTLQSEANWNATHRVAGFVWVGMGAIILITSFLPYQISIPIFIISVLTGALIPTVYSYRFYKKELAEGAEFKEAVFFGRAKKISIIMVCAVAVIIIAVLFTGEVTCTLGDDTITVDSIWWSETKIEYSEIDSVRLIEECDFGIRVSGFGSPRLSIGTFRNKAYGTYQLYAYTNNTSAIELSIDGEILLISAKEHSETLKLYEQISERIK